MCAGAALLLAAGGIANYYMIYLPHRDDLAAQLILADKAAAEKLRNDQAQKQE